MENSHISASPEHRAAHAELLDAERELWESVEHVVALRRDLPPGPPIDPATPLTTATGKPVTLGGLLGRHRTLLLYLMAFDDGWPAPHPACVLQVDCLDALVPHLAARAAVAVLAPARPGRLADLGARRGWRRVPLVSTQPSRLAEHLALPDEDGPGGGVHCLALDEHGVLRLRYRTRGRGGPEDLVTTVLALLDPLLPEPPREGTDGQPGS